MQEYLFKCETKETSCDIMLRVLPDSDKLNTISLYNMLLNAHTRDYYNRKKFKIYIIVIIVFRK